MYLRCSLLLVFICPVSSLLAQSDDANKKTEKPPRAAHFRAFSLASTGGHGVL